MRLTVDLGLAGEAARPSMPASFGLSPDGTTVAFHATPGYETYQGLGWHGVIVRRSA